MSFPVSKSNQHKAYKKRSKPPEKGCRPQLTSLIDVMTILLVYLLKSFSAEGEIVTQTKGLILPESSANKKPVLSVVLAVNKEYILAENTVIIRTSEALQDKNLVIMPLAEWLRKRRQTTEKIEAFSSKTKFSGDITIQGDKNIKFDILKKIMYTCGQEGFNNFQLAVRQKED